MTFRQAAFEAVIVMGGIAVVFFVLAVLALLIDELPWIGWLLAALLVFALLVFLLMVAPEPSYG